MGICIKKALEIISNNVSKVSFEIIPIEESQDRILAQDLFATFSLPNYNNSAMDGYAVKLSDASKKIHVIDEIFAGSDKQTKIQNNQCVKIMTGARVPSSADAVVPQELVHIHEDNYITLPINILENQHIRFIGEDIKKGEKILSNGDELNFSSITILTSQGISHVKVYRKPKVSVFTSGEELKLHYEQIEDFQLYNSNTPTLIARSKELGADVIFSGMAKDSVSSLKDLISNSLHSDFIITSGGISVGEADFTKEAFNEFNLEVLFDGITIKPGKPTVFSKINNTYILNLPGNPLASSLIFEMFGKIILQNLSGSNEVYHNYIYTKMDEELINKKGRTTIIPGYFNGKTFKAAQKRLPGMVGVLKDCNALAILNKYKDKIIKDEDVKILAINWKFFSNIKQDFFN